MFPNFPWNNRNPRRKRSGVDPRRTSSTCIDTWNTRSNLTDFSNRSQSKEKKKRRKKIQKENNRRRTGKHEIPLERGLLRPVNVCERKCYERKIRLRIGRSGRKGEAGEVQVDREEAIRAAATLHEEARRCR